MKIDSSAHLNETASPRSQSASTGNAFENMLCSLERDMWNGAASGFTPQRVREAAPKLAVFTTQRDTPAPTERSTLMPVASPTALPAPKAASQADQSAPPHASMFVDTHANLAELSTPSVAYATAFAPKNLNASRTAATATLRPPAFNTRNSEASPDLRITALNGESGALLVIRLSASASDDSAAIAKHALDTFRRHNGSGAKPTRLIVNGVEQNHSYPTHITLTSDGDHHGD